MEFDLEPGEKIVAFARKPRERVAQNLPRRERHRLAVSKINVAKEPAGVRCPRQNLERVRVGDHDEIAAALHLLHGEATAGSEDRIDRPVRGVLGQERGRHGHAAVQHRRPVGGDHRLAAQHAVLVGEREPHQFKLAFLDRLLDRLGVARLFVGPQTVALDEGCGGAARRHL